MTIPAGESTELASFAAELSLEDCSEEVIDFAVASVAALFEDASSGADDPFVRLLLAEGAVSSSIEESSIIGSRRRVGVALAATCNAASTAGRDADDQRVSAEVVASAALAVCERDRLDGAATLVAVVAGLEVSSRVAAALGGSHIERGWWLPGSAARIGAATACAKALKLSLEEHLAAIAFSSTQVAGFGSGRDRLGAILVAGRAAHDGVEAATLAQCGLTGDAEPLEGRRGLLALTSDAPERGELTAELGDRWRLLDQRIGAVSERLHESTSSIRAMPDVTRLFVF